MSDEESKVLGPSRPATRRMAPFESKLEAAFQVYESLKSFGQTERHEIIQLVNSQLIREGC